MNINELAYITAYIPPACQNRQRVQPVWKDHYPTSQSSSCTLAKILLCFLRKETATDSTHPYTRIWEL